MYLKKLILKNYCGFEDFELDLQDTNWFKKLFRVEPKIKDWLVLYGPNGSFKSSLLGAINMALHPSRFKGRTNLTAFRKLTYNKDYKPGLDFEINQNVMSIEAVFNTKHGDKKVLIRDNRDTKGEISDVEIDEVTSLSRYPGYYVNADHPSNMSIFQLKKKNREQFLDIAKVVYGFDCDIPTHREAVVEEYCSEENKYLYFCTDFVLNKYNNTKVHFKRMSDGERKIAVMLRELFNNCYDVAENEKNIILIDNVMMHIYHSRHMKLIEKLREHFPNKQFIVTTHSPVVINKMKNKYLLDMEKNNGAK